MKIGILTYHRTLNYGACLQAVATRVVLENLGHEVHYVDYWPDYHSIKYKAFSFKRFKYFSVLGCIKYIIDSIREYKYRKERIDNFELFFNKYIYPYCSSTKEAFDVIVYGSDQIWRKHSALKDYNPVYFGINDFKTKYHIAYSASMGILPSSNRDTERVKQLVSHMDKIAVREENLKKFLLSLGFKNIQVTLDPTLLLDKNEWNNIIPIKTTFPFKYMLLYSIGSSAFDVTKVRNYANDHGCELVILTGTATMQSEKLLYTTAGPYTFLDLIQQSECVFTSSFHGLAFSIIFEKEFIASYHRNSNRAETLLNSVGIKNRIIAPQSDIPSLSPLNYECIKENLNLLRIKSFEYLKELHID